MPRHEKACPYAIQTAMGQAGGVLRAAAGTRDIATRGLHLERLPTRRRTCQEGVPI